LEKFIPFSDNSPDPWRILRARPTLVYRFSEKKPADSKNWQQNTIDRESTEKQNTDKNPTTDAGHSIFDRLKHCSNAVAWVSRKKGTDADRLGQENTK